MSSTLILHARRQKGFSLIEVLVAMLVLAIGLLGLAALQTQGVRFNHDAYVRTSATSLAADIFDKMRLNRANLIDADGNAVYDTDNWPALGSCTLAAAAVADVATELACWMDGVQNTLPMGDARIDQQAGNPALYDITFTWLDREPRKGTGQLATATNCADIANRVWNATAGRCFVTQTWTIWP